MVNRKFSFVLFVFMDMNLFAGLQIQRSCHSSISSDNEETIIFAGYSQYNYKNCNNIKKLSQKSWFLSFRLALG